ncbi:ABC transporter substrate-binding protein [Colwellia sp. BRX10-3]|uniref:MlaC/ttg2D family ABC transporter substrate-binding protein n=1 Tax=Colwellia sp. BRX10-3 TaxID=2759844 RepID=UPI0015F77477|nr:ABC transporter substrate-binding protein [Colwellia sp. BRX10-3]MBA6391192.1 ABC transporter substrate-binding protein [Colwellia sp. BRX10-3]
MKLVKAIFSRIVLILISISVANAGVHDEQKVLGQVKSATNNILAILVDPMQSKNVKSNKIFSIVNGLIDFDLMAKLSIGKSVWKEFNPKQKKEYLGLFVEHFKLSYLKTMFAFQQQEIVVEKAEQYKPTRIAVTTYILESNNSVKLLYKFYQKKENVWLAYDIRVDGVSVVQIQRSQYKELLNTYSIDEFIEKLRQNNESKQ